jgi:hypothetical protein
MIEWRQIVLKEETKNDQTIGYRVRHRSHGAGAWRSCTGTPFRER